MRAIEILEYELDFLLKSRKRYEEEIPRLKELLQKEGSHYEDCLTKISDIEFAIRILEEETK